MRPHRHGICGDELLCPAMFERVRPAWQRELLDLKCRRRVRLGRNCSVTFETRSTVLWHVHELIRVEAMRRPGQIQRLLDECAPLVPSPGRLTATLYIHGGTVCAGATLARELSAELGVVSIEAAACRIIGRGWAPVAKYAEAVHYLEFVVEPGISRALTGVRAARLRLRSLAERACVPLPPEVLGEITLGQSFESSVARASTNDAASRRPRSA